MPRNKYGEEIRRLYNPSEDPRTSSIPLSELLFYDRDRRRVSHLRMNVMSEPDPIVDETSVVVFIDGACRNNGQPTARASWAVSFGWESRYNTGGLLDKSLPQTSTRAEIEALIQALDVIRYVTDIHFTRRSRVIIATDSSFLVKAMTQWMERWIENDGVGTNGEPVAHFQVLKKIHDLLNEMERSDEARSREIWLWHVPREMNRDADGIANRVLDEA
ncbi:hypothetical protein J4E85_007826 [Alternaria conjuncta]|uniref:uncharacterized protein n=1 Tax=Alternaria conjuncta TaxID=181017 RepID=UPI00221F6B8B|nr:uncharacterized protein J4E85_007826 [Alternaria conjuncta]KAI4924709.1 hypothetical protein J4E85_007826 [Alternaria conjuncta]